MTPALAVAMLVAIVIAVAVALAWIERRDTEDASNREEAWLPRELAGASLLLSEPRPLVASVDQLDLVAKPDRAYVRNDGSVQLVELKTRREHRVFPDDLIELSVQRVVIQRALAKHVDDDAFVVTQLVGDSLDRRLHRVRLLSETAVLELAARYEGLLKGRLQPRRTSNARKCRTCGHRSTCGRDQISAAG